MPTVWLDVKVVLTLWRPYSLHSKISLGLSGIHKDVHLQMQCHEMHATVEACTKCAGAQRDTLNAPSEGRSTWPGALSRLHHWQCYQYKCSSFPRGWLMFHPPGAKAPTALSIHTAKGHLRGHPVQGFPNLAGPQHHLVPWPQPRDSDVTHLEALKMLSHCGHYSQPGNQHLGITESKDLNSQKKKFRGNSYPQNWNDSIKSRAY